MRAQIFISVFWYCFVYSTVFVCVCVCCHRFLFIQFHYTQYHIRPTYSYSKSFTYLLVRRIPILLVILFFLYKFVIRLVVRRRHSIYTPLGESKVALPTLHIHIFFILFHFNFSGGAVLLRFCTNIDKYKKRQFLLMRCFFLLQQAHEFPITLKTMAECYEIIYIDMGIGKFRLGRASWS